MKTRILCSVMLAFGIFMSACTKPEPEPQPEMSEELAAFLGTYDIHIVTDSVMTDNSWFSTAFLATIGKTYPDQYGTLSISPSDDPQQVRITSRVSESGQLFYDYYVTTASLTPDGRLLPLNSSTYIGTEYPTLMNFVYEPISLAETLAFKVRTNFIFAELNCGYVLSNTAAKNLYE